MKLQLSCIDTSGITDYFAYVRERSMIDRALDPHYELRMALGLSLAPSRYQTYQLGPLLMVLSLEES